LAENQKKHQFIHNASAKTRIVQHLKHFEGFLFGLSIKGTCFGENREARAELVKIDTPMTGRIHLPPGLGRGRMGKTWGR